jgi:hypothetical protein
MKMNRQIPTGVAMTLLALVLIGWWWMGNRTSTSPSEYATEETVVGVPITSTPATRPRPSPVIPVTNVALPVSQVVNNVSPVNAADLYRKAFNALDTLSAEEKKALSDWKTAVSPSLAAELCGKIGPICALAHEAATLTNCDWSIPKVKWNTRLPELESGRSLAQTLIWSAVHCQSENAVGIGADLEATLRLGQNMPQVLFGHLGNTRIQNTALNYLAAHGTELSPEVLMRLESFFANDRQYAESFYGAMIRSVGQVEEMADEFAAMGSNEFRDKLNEAQKKCGNEKTAMALASMNQADVVAAMRQVAELRRECIALLNASDAQYQAWLKKVQAAEQNNPTMQFYVPMDHVIEQTQTMVLNRAMTAAGLALLQNDANALSKYLDPATGQPFLYRQTATGFELQSGYQRNGEPVILTFANR